MKTVCSLLLSVLAVAGGWCDGATANDDVEHQLSTIESLMDTHCVECHHASDPAGGLDLEAFDLDVAGGSEAWDTTAWERITKRLRARQMPPPDSDSRPSEQEYQHTLAALETILDVHAEQNPNPGRTDAVRRLNRTEYRNAIRDLLSINVNVDDMLPADQLGHGFDNVTVGELSPLLLNRYITAAQHISRLAVGGQQRSPGGVTMRLPADRTQASRVDGLPLGTRGGTLFDHHFELDGEYEIQLRLMRDRDENIEGLTGPHDIDVLIDRELVHRFTVAPPKNKDGWKKDDTLVDANLVKRFRVSAGTHDVGVTFPRTALSLSQIRRQPFDASFNRHRHPRPSPALYEVSIAGPFDPQGPGETASRAKIFTVVPEGKTLRQATAAAEKILSRLIRLAYRRPVTEADLVIPMRFFRERFDVDGYEPAIQSALSVILVNPHFLFRAETDPGDVESGQCFQVSDLELATRLSFFLWSSLPDEELLELAERGQLHQDDVLEHQVRRMLADDRSESLVNNFAVQWLYLRNLKSFRPDMRLYPDFDDNLRASMRRETELLFQHVMRSDRSVLELIRTDVTHLDERLARHYGIGGVVGSHFRPVQVSANSHRGGILRHGSILAVTSYATRTSPTIRGNWILENILGTAPPPPPPNVPSLAEKNALAKLTVRERLAAHRANPACASCHNLMDPVGFALENFDAVGRWRNFEDEMAIDSSGALPDGHPIDSVRSLEEGIMKRPEMFVGTMTEKMLTFALGRGIEAYDGPAVRKIVREAAKNDYRFSSLIIGITKSTPFQKRTAQ